MMGASWGSEDAQRTITLEVFKRVSPDRTLHGKSGTDPGGTPPTDPFLFLAKLLCLVWIREIEARKPVRWRDRRAVFIAGIEEVKLRRSQSVLAFASKLRSVNSYTQVSTD